MIKINLKFIMKMCSADHNIFNHTSVYQCVVQERIHTLPTEDHWKFLMRGVGRGGIKAKLLEEYQAKLEFPGGWGCKTKNLPWVECGYILELHNFVLDTPAESPESIQTPPVEGHWKFLRGRGGGHKSHTFRRRTCIKLN